MAAQVAAAVKLQLRHQQVVQAAQSEVLPAVQALLLFRKVLELLAALAQMEEVEQEQEQQQVLVRLHQLL